MRFTLMHTSIFTSYIVFTYIPQYPYNIHTYLYEECTTPATYLDYMQTTKHTCIQTILLIHATTL